MPAIEISIFKDCECNGTGMVTDFRPKDWEEIPCTDCNGDGRALTDLGKEVEELVARMIIAREAQHK